MSEIDLAPIQLQSSLIFHWAARGFCLPCMRLKKFMAGFPKMWQPKLPDLCVCLLRMCMA